jgi:hypothetical protein
MSMEMSYLKFFLASKLKLNIEEMRYGQKLTKMKILDSLAVNMIDLHF